MRYFDTSVLFKIYVEEARSDEAIALVKKGISTLARDSSARDRNENRISCQGTEG
jgi:predicted nucleic acid-binding protein